MDTTTETSSTQNKMLTGCVKWFNNNLNYGFITVLTEGAHHNMDIFSHQTNIKTKRDCFRTLYTGECVQFELAKSNNEKHPVHAINISGFNIDNNDILLNKFIGSVSISTNNICIFFFVDNKSIVLIEHVLTLL